MFPAASLFLVELVDLTEKREQELIKVEIWTTTKSHCWFAVRNTTRLISCSLKAAHRQDYFC